MERITRSLLFSKIPQIQHGFTTKLLPKNEQDLLEAKTATVRQVHGNKLVWLNDFEKRTREADALATKKWNLKIGVYSADCTPVLAIALKEQSPVAIIAIHAGWRGTAKKIVEKSLDDFFSCTKTEATRYIMAIGPCISKDSFEVGAEVVEAFPHAEAQGLSHFLRLEGDKKKFLFDLPGENLRQAKIAAEKSAVSLEIENLGHCTLLEPNRYPSFRREKEKAGRILSFLSIEA